MNLKSHLEALRAGAPPPGDPAHARVDAVLRSLAAEEVEVLGRVLDRWTEAGHPADLVPSLSDLEPDDTGNVFDADRKVLIATPQEWALYTRARSKLEGLEDSP